MKKYIVEYDEKYYSFRRGTLSKDDYIKMVTESLMSYPKYCKEFVDTFNIALIAKKQKLKNDSIIQSNKNTINDIISKNEKITNEITNLNTKIMDLYKAYSSNFFHTSLKGDFILYDHPTNHEEDDYEKNDYLENRKETIARNTEVLQELDMLSQKHENDIKNIKARLEKLKSNKNNLKNQLNKISKENIDIDNITNNYEQIYNSKYLELISDYKRKLNRINTLNTETKIEVI